MTSARPSSDHFDALFQADADPWRTRTRWYEKRKRDLVLAMLPRQRFLRVFEPGCGAGELSLALARRSEVLVATDASAVAIEHAQRRAGALPGVRLGTGRIPQDWPAGRFDLIVISELGYYLDAEELDALMTRCHGSLSEDGCLLACHWRRGTPDMLASADAVHMALSRACGGRRLGRYEDDDLLLDLWCNDARSVAQQEGLA